MLCKEKKRPSKCNELGFYPLYFFFLILPHSLGFDLLQNPLDVVLYTSITVYQRGACCVLRIEIESKDICCLYLGDLFLRLKKKNRKHIFVRACDFDFWDRTLSFSENDITFIRLNSNDLNQ